MSFFPKSLRISLSFFALLVTFFGGPNAHCQQQNITLIPGIDLNPREALTREGTLSRVTNLTLKDSVGGSLVSFDGLQLRIWVNWDVLLNPVPQNAAYGAVINGGYGWDITSTNSPSMPGMLTYLRDPLFNYVGPEGQRFLILIAPTLGHMVGATSNFTGASVGNARIVAFSVLLLRALGFDANHTVLTGFSRGSEAHLGAISRYGDLACDLEYIAGSFDRGLDTPSPTLANGLVTETTVNLHACQIDDWARSVNDPYIDRLDHALRGNRSQALEVPGSLKIHSCIGHDASLMHYQSKMFSSIDSACGRSSVIGSLPPSSLRPTKGTGGKKKHKRREVNS